MKTILAVLFLALFSGAATVPTGITNVYNYGAKCDGITDDTVAIQAAIVAAGGALQTVSAGSVLTIPGRCLIRNTLIVFNRNFFPSGSNSARFVFRCSGAGAGLIWGGADNSGPMITFGDGSGTDNGFEIHDCSVGGKDRNSKPSIAIQFNSVNQASIFNNNFGWVHDAFQCVTMCLLLDISDNTFGGCYNTCVNFLALNNMVSIKNNEFAYCGNFCINSVAGDSLNIVENDFEGNVGGVNSDIGGSAGSIGLGLGNSYASAKIIRNRFEDANAAAGKNFRSIVINKSVALLENNYYGANATYPGGPDFYIYIGPASTVHFVEESLANAPGVGSSGFIVDVESTSGVKWYGGLNCNPAAIFGGAMAWNAVAVSAC